MAAFASAPPDPLAPAPDPQDALIQAVRDGDAAVAARWLQRWVHRRGVASLEPLFARVASLQGPQAADWLRRQLETPVVASTAAAVAPQAVAVATAPEPTPEPVVAFEPTPEPAATSESMAEPVMAAGPGQPSEQPLPAAQDVPAAPAGLEFPPLEFELPSFELPSFELPPLDPPAAAATEVAATAAPQVPAASGAAPAVPPLPREWSLDLESAFPPLGTAMQTSPARQETPAVSDLTAPADAAPEADPTPTSRPRGPFSRMRSLVRGCIEEAREALHRFDPAELDGEEGDEEFIDPEEPERQPARSAQTALAEIPSFLGEGTAAASSRAPGTAAPAPSALSDLRGWLPEADDQLPRAS